jgi:hypothetical protein
MGGISSCVRARHCPARGLGGQRSNTKKSHGKPLFEVHFGTASAIGLEIVLLERASQGPFSLGWTRIDRENCKIADTAKIGKLKTQKLRNKEDRREEAEEI